MSGLPANQGRRPARTQPIAGAIGWPVLAGTALGTSAVVGADRQAAVSCHSSSRPLGLNQTFNHQGGANRTPPVVEATG